MNILLVEDDAGLVELITAMLEELDYSVLSATSGAEALVHLKKQMPDLMLLDYSLPDVNGKELIETLSEKSISRPPFIITTGQGDERIAVDMMKLGAMDYLVKDILFLERLPEVVRRVIKEIQNINKLKQAEEEIKIQQEQIIESEKKYRDLINLAQEGIWVIDKESITSFANPSMARMLKYSPEEMVGKSLFDFMDEHGRKIANERLEGRRTGHKENHDFEFICKDDERIFCTMSTAPILDKEGNYQGAIAGVIDITERKRAEEKIRAAEESLKNTFDISPSIISKANVNTGYFVEVNSAVTRILGYTLEEFMSKPFIEFIYPEDRQRTANEVLRQLEGSSTAFFENRYLCKDGAYKWMAWHSTRADEKGIVTAIASDITESKQAADLLLSNKRRLDYALKSIETGAWELDLEKKDSWRSFEHDKIFGYDKPLKVWTFDMFLEHVVPEDRAMVNDKFTTAVEAKADWEFECRIKRADGPIRWILGKGNHELTKDKTTQKMFGVVQDITEKKIAEEKLKDSEQKYKALYENAPLSYQSLNEDGTFKDINPHWLETLGYERDEVIGQRYADFLHPEWKKHFEKNFPAFKKRGYVSDVQFKIRHKAGHYIDISFEGCIGYNPDGTFRQTYCVFQDITARLLAEKKLKISEERFRQLYNNSPDMHASILPGDVSILMCNDTLLKNIGYSREEIIGEPIYKIYHEDCMADVKEAVQQFRSTGIVDNRELILRRKDGSKIEVILKVYAVRDASGKILHSMASWRDITESKRTNEKMQAAEESLKNTFDLSPSIIAKVNVNIGRFVEVSSAVTRILGYSVEEFTSRPYIEFIHPEDRQKNSGCTF